MHTFDKSHKLDRVCYDIRGPVMDEANRMLERGEKIIRLNIGNPAPFGFRAPQAVIDRMAENLTETEGYSDSKGLMDARRAIVAYCKSKALPNVTENDVYTGNGVSDGIVGRKSLSVSVLRPGSTGEISAQPVGTSQDPTEDL